MSECAYSQEIQIPIFWLEISVLLPFVGIVAILNIDINSLSVQSLLNYFMELRNSVGDIVISSKCVNVHITRKFKFHKCSMNFSHFKHEFRQYIENSIGQFVSTTLLKLLRRVHLLLNWCHINFLLWEYF